MIEEQDGAKSLKAFLYLLQIIDNEQNGGMNPLIVSEQSETLFKLLSASYQEELIDQLSFSNDTLRRKLNLNLVLRHCASHLFEEANLYAHISGQLSLFPTIDLSYEYRNFKSTVYTPTYVARSIVEESLRSLGNIMDRESITVFDPACGSGLFISETLRQLEIMGYKGKINAILWDKSETAIDVSKFLMSFEQREWGGQLEYTCVNNNSLTNNWPKADLILMNPPYMSWDLMIDDERIQVMEILGSKNCKKPNLSSVFYHLATQSLKENGAIGCLFPSTVLYSDAHRFIREQSLDFVTPNVIGRLGSSVFGHKMVDVSVLVASKREQCDILWCPNLPNVAPNALSKLRLVRQSNGIIEEDDCNIYPVIFKDYKKFNNESWMPIPYREFEFKYKLEDAVQRGLYRRIKDVFEIKQGIRTGANKVFILDEVKYNSLPAKERKFFRPSIDNDAIRNGVLKTLNYVFYPLDEDFSGEGDLKAKIPVYYENYLLPNKSKLVNRSDIDETKWWILTRSRNWLLEKKTKLVSSEFGNSSKFSYDINGDCVIERGCYWKPKSEMTLDEEFAYLAIFRSSIMNRLLAMYSKQLSGGEWYALSQTNVGLIPLPKFDEFRFNGMFKQLADIGECMAKNLPYEKSVLEQIVSVLYKM